MIIKTKTKEEIKDIIENIKNVSTLDNMIKLASCTEGDLSDVVIYIDKNDNEMICLCEDDDCQFEEKCVHSLEDVINYISEQLFNLINGN